MRKTTLGAALASAVLAVGLASTVASAETPAPKPTPECGAAIQAVVTFDLAGKVATANQEAKRWDNRAKQQHDLRVSADAEATRLQNEANDTPGLSDEERTALRNQATAKRLERDAADKAHAEAVDAHAAAKAKATTGLQAELDALVKTRDEVCAPKPGPIGAPGPSGAPGVPGLPGKDAPKDLDCRDFPNRAAAQVELDKDKSDPHNLDVDNDGQACEVDEPPAPPRAIVVNPQFVTVPNTTHGVDTGDGSLA